MRNYIFSDKDMQAIRVLYWEKEITPHMRRVISQCKKAQKRLYEEFEALEWICEEFVFPTEGRENE